MHLDTRAERGALTTSGAPAATATDQTLPDPTTILDNASRKFGLIKSARDHQVVNDNQVGVGTLGIDISSDATCAPYLFTRAKGTQQVTGTAQKSTENDRFEQYKKQGWANTPKTKGKWAKAKPSSFQVYGFSIGNPLLCSSSGSSSGGTTTSPCGDGIEYKDLNNNGQQTFAGLPVWDISATELVFDQNCNQIASGTLHYLVSTAQYLPLQTRLSLTDSTGSETLTITDTLKDFGVKLKPRKIKLGSRTP